MRKNRSEEREERKQVASSRSGGTGRYRRCGKGRYCYDGDKRTRLWSFVVKKVLNMSNVREAFFRAVSNSSWANLGYLVAAKTSDEETMRELWMLNAEHGIGVIQLDILNVSESQILIPAREQEWVDWNSCAGRLRKTPISSVMSS